MTTSLVIPTVTGKVHPSVVYYCRRGGLIKIGYTTRYVDRMKQIEPDEILAVEPGGLDVESVRHRQFAFARIHSCSDLKEWYGLAPELQGYIEKLAELFEVPPLPKPRQRTPGRPTQSERTGYKPLHYGPRDNCRFKRSTAEIEDMA